MGVYLTRQAKCAVDIEENELLYRPAGECCRDHGCSGGGKLTNVEVDHSYGPAISGPERLDLTSQVYVFLVIPLPYNPFY